MIGRLIVTSQQAHADRRACSKMDTGSGPADMKLTGAHPLSPGGECSSTGARNEHEVTRAVLSANRAGGNIMEMRERNKGCVVPRGRVKRGWTRKEVDGSTANPTWKHGRDRRMPVTWRSSEDA